MQELDTITINLFFAIEISPFLAALKISLNAIAPIMP